MLVKNHLLLSVVLSACAASAAMAQDATTITVTQTPAETIAAPAPEAPAGGLAGYVSSARPVGMGTGGSAPVPTTQFPMTSPEGLPAIVTGTELTADRIEGFNDAATTAFPMTPDMVRQYRKIYEEQQRAILERPEPTAMIDTGLVSLEPGEAAPDLKVASGIASVLGFYDVTGQPWPVVQYVIGSAEKFQVIQMGEDANNLSVTPIAPLGWSNLIVQLEGESKPVIVRLEISDREAHYRRDIQIMRPGPNASQNMASGATSVVTEAGSEVLLAALAGVDMPAQAVPVSVSGVNARGWLLGDSVYLRSQDALLSPSWMSSIAGPDGVRVYQIATSSVALFSVNGTVVRADINLP